MLLTAKKRSTKSTPRELSQCVYFDVYTSYAHHKLPAYIYDILAVVDSVITNLVSQRSASTNCMSQLNSEVSSWNTKRQIFPTSSLIFTENIGKDDLSSQSPYDVKFDYPHHIDAIASNPKLLQDSLPRNGNMRRSYKILVKAINERTRLPGGIRAIGSAMACFFHPSQKIPDQWPNNDKRRLTGVIVTEEAKQPVNHKQQLGYLVCIQEINDGTEFYIVKRNFKV